MSHFTVLVIGDNPEEQLKPYQENNMGDCPDKYLEFRDDEEENRKEYENNSSEMIRLESGELCYTWDKQFEKGDFFNRTYEYPKNSEKVTIVHKDRFATFEEYMSDYCGYDEKDSQTGKYGRWVNPNAKWDWYQLGGRWTGFFKLKSTRRGMLLSGSVDGFTQHELWNLVKMSENDTAKFEKVVSKYQGKADQIRKIIEDYKNPITQEVLPEHEIGTPGLMTEQAKEGYADQARKSDIDFDAMRKEAGEKAYERYDTIERLFGGNIPKIEISWESLLNDASITDHQVRRDTYWNQPAMLSQKDVRKNYDKNLFTHDETNLIAFFDLQDYQCTKEQYIQNARDNAISTFAMVYNGVWYEKGQMGWWACVSNEIDQELWNSKFNELLDSIPDNTLLSLYDCHI